VTKDVHWWQRWHTGYYWKIPK